MKKKEPVLCYIDGNWAFFTTQVLSKQWGDDWDDAPHDCNAGHPYEYDEEHDKEKGKWEITRIGFSDVFYMCDTMNDKMKYLSVQDMNSGKWPWLRISSGNDYIKIYAGCKLSEFKKTVKENGGKVFVEEK